MKEEHKQGQQGKPLFSPEVLAAMARLAAPPKPMTPEEMDAADEYLRKHGWSGPSYPPHGTTIGLVPKPNKE